MNAKVLTTGSTGTNGKELIRQFVENGVPVRAMTRGSAKTPSFGAHPLVQPVIGDFDDAGSLYECLRGVERAFLVTNSTEQSEERQLRFVEQAKRAGVRHVVKLSQYAAELDSPVRFLRYHAAVESAIAESGMAYTFLRPNLFMQGLLLFRSSILQQGRFFAPIEDARVSLVDVRDIAEVAFRCLTATGHEGKVYTLTGPAAQSHEDLAVTLSSALGREIQFVNVNEDALRQALAGLGMPEWQCEGLIEDYAHYRRGEAAEVSTDIAEVIHRPATSFAEFAARVSGEFLTPRNAA